MPQDDPHYRSAYWRALRQLVFDRDDRRCVLCDSPDDLQCHHRNYVRKGKEELRDCYTLCQGCHDLVTDHQRRQRYTIQQDPPVQEVEAPEVVYMFGSSYREIPLETNCEIPSDRRGTALDAQWTTERSAERMEQSQKEDYGQAKKDRRRSRGNWASRMDGEPLSVQWGSMHSSRGAEGYTPASGNVLEKRTES
jgi:hypothetical protein